MTRPPLRAVWPAALAAAFSPALLAAAPLDTPGWELVWKEDFSGPAVDTEAWEVLNRRDSFNNEKQYYREEQVSIVDDKLRLTAVDEPLANKDYRSGLVRTREEWSYGRFEVRADLPTTQGMWPAIWLLPRTVAWPLGGEIDIMENRGSEPLITSSAYHWNNVPNTSNFVTDEYTATNPDGTATNFHEGFHDYAVEWERDEIRFYVDGNRHFVVTSDTAPIFATAKSLILNLAVGGTFGGDPDGRTVFPQHFDIESVRVWQRENGFFGLVNSGFDEDGGALTNWTAFNDNGDNLRVDAVVAYTGENALVLEASAGGPDFAGVFQGVRVEGGETLRARVESLVEGGGQFGAGTTAEMKIEFYSREGAPYGSSDFLGEEVLTLDTGELDSWRHNEFLVDAPADAVEARMTLIVVGSDGEIALDGAALQSIEPLAGDYNFDGVVDAADFTAWRDTNGSRTNLAADGNRDGVVNEADRELWKGQLGAGAAAPVAVPTPGALPLSAAGGLVTMLASLRPAR